MCIQSKFSGGLAVLLAASAVSTASAQEASSMSQFERPYGYAYGSEDSAYSASTRDLNNNRVVINGMIGGGTGLGTGLYTRRLRHDRFGHGSW